MWSTPSMTTILAPAAVVPALLHTPRPLLQIVFVSVDSLQTFLASFPLRLGEQWQEEPLSSSTAETKDAFRFILVSPYVLAGREQAQYLCQCEIRAGWRNWRYLPDREL